MLKKGIFFNSDGVLLNCWINDYSTNWRMKNEEERRSGGGG
jgi:hypothetical protein